MLASRAAILLLGLCLCSPAASAWVLPLGSGAPEQGAAADAARAWTFGVAQALPDPSGAAGAAACALGDLNGDGVGDLLVQARGLAGGRTRLTALAGPSFHTALWSSLGPARRVLECAPDLDLDGIADPVLRTVGAAASTLPGDAAAAERSAQQVLQVVSGATGRALAVRTHAETQAGATTPAAGAGQQATAALLPAAAGAAAFLQATVRQAHALAPAAGELPALAATATLQASAHLEILDSAGAAVARIDLSQPGQVPLAVAPLPTGRLPSVAALTRQSLSPVEEVAGSVPHLALYAADGTLAWSTSLAASTGVPLLVPRIGDLDLDGLPDLLVETVQQGVPGAPAAPAAAFQVLSGLDGGVLLSSGAPVDGLLAALPLGELPAGPALLKAQRLAGAAATTLSALDATGQAQWSVEVDATAQPVNHALDPHTGDVVGFTDLTGDGLPDVGVAVAQGGALALKAVDGATGKVAWAASVADARQAVPFVLGAGAGAVQATAGSPAALLAVGGGAAPVLTLLDAATGGVVWTARASVAAGAQAAVNLTVQAAGDLDADGVQDLLVTALRGSAGLGTSVFALSGATGATLWASATDATQPTLDLAFSAAAGPAFRAVPASAADSTVKAPPILLAPALAALALAAAAGRNRRR